MDPKLQQFEETPRTLRDALFQIVPPHEWVRVSVRGEAFLAPGVALKESQRAQINAALAEHGLSPLPFAPNGPLLWREAVEADLAQAGIADPFQPASLTTQGYGAMAQEAVQNRYAKHGAAVLEACRNFGLSRAETETVYADSHYAQAEAVVAGILADPIRLARLEQQFGTAMRGLEYRVDKNQPHHQLQKIENIQENSNPYATLRAAREIEALHQSLQAQAQDYFGQKNLPFETPRLDFVYEPGDGSHATAVSGANIVVINLAQYDPNYDYRGFLAHEYVHLAHDDSDPCRTIAPRDAELRANREAAEMLGSPVPMLVNYFQAMVESGRIDAVPSSFTPESVRAVAQGLEEGKTLPDYPTRAESLQDLAVLDFGWEQKPLPTHQVRAVTHRDRLRGGQASALEPG